MSDAIEVRPVRSSKDKKTFLRLHHSFYKDDPAYVVPLEMEQADLINQKKNPWFQHAEAELFIAWKNGQPVGRISAQIDQEHLKLYKDQTGFFGFFECIEDQKVADALLEAAENWLLQKGITRIRGPFSFSINEYAGLLIEGFDTPPAIMMNHHLPYYQGLIEKAGYEKVKDLVAFSYDAVRPPPEMSAQLADEVAKYPGLKIREVDKKNLLADLKIVLDVFNECWAKNWGFVPLTAPEVEKVAKDLSLILEPKLALIAEVDGEPAAISIAVPNVNEALQGLDGRLSNPATLVKFLWRLKVQKVKTARLMLLGVRPKFRGTELKWLSVLLYVEMHRRGQELGLRGGELSWTLEDNEKINSGIELMGGERYKKYRVFEKSLTGENDDA